MKKEKLAEVPWRNFERAAFQNRRELPPLPSPPLPAREMRVHSSGSLNNDACGAGFDFCSFGFGSTGEERARVLRPFTRSARVLYFKPREMEKSSARAPPGGCVSHQALTSGGESPTLKVEAGASAGKPGEVHEPGSEARTGWSRSELGNVCETRLNGS